mmetsp:Transcript_41977/g.133330  ORF Transcript_41977/g.133330 Transcript_41977/m.133330 type:complete len:520 (-) Transcript_41977:193-1752(-)
MPLVVDLLLLDEGNLSVPDGTSHASTAKGIYMELERQLQDSNSHLRRKSAFGALVARDASVRFVDFGDHEGCSDAAGLLSKTSAPVAAASMDGAASAVPTGGTHPEATPESSGAALLGRPGQVLTAPSRATVPRIPDFPRPRAGPSVIPGGGMDFVASLFSWMPSCAPVPCKSLEADAIDSCTIVLAPPDAGGPCVPVPAGALLPREDSSAVFEAGLGGWPLCVPHAYAAFPAPDPPASMHGCNAHGDICRSAWTPGTLRGARFRKAAVEVDDAELAVILVPLRGQHGCSLSSSVQTPSTASTVGSLTPSAATPPGTVYNRLVISREGITGVKHWPKLDAARLAPADPLSSGDVSPPWPNIVEVSGTPCGGTETLTVLLALPSSSLASRLHDGLNGVWRRARSAAHAKGTRRAVRCELRINANLKLGAVGDELNCAAVVRRGICEACHVGAERVRVCGLRMAEDGPGTVGGPTGPWDSAALPTGDAVAPSPGPPSTQEVSTAAEEDGNWTTADDASTIE